jgi:hypothetical protein
MDMPRLHMKHSHLMHDTGVRLSHIMHDERFWLIITLAILAGLIALSVWAGIKSGGMGEAPPVYPYFPY